MDFFLLLKILIKIFVKVSVKTQVLNTARDFLIMLNNLQQKHLKMLQKINSKNSRSNF